MTYEDQVLALYGEANPVSDADKLEVFMSSRLEMLERRTGGMTDTRVPDVDQNRPIVRSDWRRGLVYGLAAVVGILIVGAVTWMVFLNDVEADPASPVDVGRSFIEARDAWDAEATTALLAPDAIVSDLEVPQHADYAAQYRWYEAVGWRWAVEECVEVVPGPATSVTCSYTMENAWSRARQVAPITGSMDFVVAEGHILEVTHGPDFNLADFDPIWSAFRSWVGVNYDVRDLYVDGKFVPIYTTESMALWEQYTNEYVASVTNSDTP